MIVYNRCSLCFDGGTDEFYNKMINYNGFVLCNRCYERYKNADKIEEIAILSNTIRMYRRILEKCEEIEI